MLKVPERKPLLKKSIKKERGGFGQGKKGRIKRLHVHGGERRGRGGGKTPGGGRQHYSLSEKKPEKEKILVKNGTREKRKKSMKLASKETGKKKDKVPSLARFIAGRGGYKRVNEKKGQKAKGKLVIDVRGRSPGEKNDVEKGKNRDKETHENP